MSVHESVMTPDAVAGLGSILGVWAHPDDEAYLSGGLMALAREAGQRVVCVTATRGELGTSDPVAWPPQRLARERTRELTRSLHVLGVREHHWLGYRDGELAAAGAPHAVARLAELIDRIRPDTVLTFGPDGLTGHPDHQTVSAWTGAAFEAAAPAGARLLHAAMPEQQAARDAELDAGVDVYLPGYPVTVPADRLAVDLVLPPAVATRKVRALGVQVTQTAVPISVLGIERYTAWVSEESFVEAARQPAGGAVNRGSGSARSHPGPVPAPPPGWATARQQRQLAAAGHR